MPALLTRRVGGLLRLHLLEHSRQSFVVDDRTGLHRWILSNTLKPSVVPLN
jgi:hypothetical protein